MVKMIVDSKVSNTAYEKYINEEDDEQKSSFLKEHVNSLKRHVEQLEVKIISISIKMESPDFVFTFHPNRTCICNCSKRRQTQL